MVVDCLTCIHKDNCEQQDRPFGCISPIIKPIHYATKKQTNADRIRQMSDEELAKLISDACPPRHKENRCVRFFQKGDGCQGCWLDWLKQEVERDE